MEGFYFSSKLDNDRTLCLAPITDRRLEMSSDVVSDVSGYFLYELSGIGESAQVHIIAQITSEDAVERLRDLLSLE